METDRIIIHTNTKSRSIFVSCHYICYKKILCKTTLWLGGFKLHGSLHLFWAAKRRCKGPKLCYAKMLVSEGAQKELRWIMSSIYELSLPMTKLHLAFTCRPLTGTKQPWFGSSWKASRANFKMAVGDWPFSSFRELQSRKRPRPIEKQSEPMNA